MYAPNLYVYMRASIIDGYKSTKCRYRRVRRGESRSGLIARLYMGTINFVKETNKIVKDKQSYILDRR